MLHQSIIWWRLSEKIIFHHGSIVILIHDRYLWLNDLESKFALAASLFGAVKLTKNSYPDKYSYSGSGIGKNAMIFGVDNSSSQHADNRKKTLIFGKGPTDGLDDTTSPAEAEYSINFSEQQNKFFLNLHDNGSNSYLFVNGVKTCQFKAKDWKI